MKIIRTLILIILLLLSCGAFDDAAEMTADDNLETETVPAEEISAAGEPAAEDSVSENPEEAVPQEELPSAEQTSAESAEEQPVEEELPQPEWQGLNSDQVDALRFLYDQMTITGQASSGWFTEDSWSPCDWQGVACEGDQVSALEFRDAVYFTTFPSGLDRFQSLKELHLVDTLIQGPLPENFWENLPSLEVLELSGNLLTGEIPALPEQFAVYPVLRTIIMKDNKPDERKQSLPAYADASSVYLDPQNYPDVDLNPGLDGSLPEDWSRLPLLQTIELSGNTLSGAVPDAWMALPLTAWNLSDNAEILSLSQVFYDQILASGNSELKLDGLEIPVPEPQTPEVVPTDPVIPEEIPTEEPPVQPTALQPTEVPAVVPTAVPEQPAVPPVQPAAPQPTEVPPVVPTDVPAQPVVPPAQPTVSQPTDVPAVVPTSVPAQPIYIVVTATAQPQWYTATPVPAQPGQQQPYPGGGYPQQPDPQQPYSGGYQPQPQQQPTLMIYPLFTSVPPTEIPTAAQTEDPALQRQRVAASFDFTYVLESMTGNSLPMTWRNNGMNSYSISYLDANGNLYPAYAMTWTETGQLCHSDVCTFTVSEVPEELLHGGTFSLRLEAKDENGQLYQTDPLPLAVSVPEQEPAPQPELHVLSTLLRWLFSPILNLFR